MRQEKTGMQSPSSEHAHRGDRAADCALEDMSYKANGVNAKEIYFS